MEFLPNFLWLFFDAILRISKRKTKNVNIARWMINFYGHWDGARVFHIAHPYDNAFENSRKDGVASGKHGKRMWSIFVHDDSRSLRSIHTHVHFTPSFLIRTKTFGVFTGNVSRLERGTKDKSLRVTFSIYKMLKGKSLKWTWKVFLRGFSSEIVK